MTRSESAFFRAVRHYLTKANRLDAWDQQKAMRMYDLWVKPRQAALSLINGDTK